VRKVSIGLGTLAAIGALALPASALAAQTLTLSPSLSGKLGGPGKLTFAFTVGTSPAAPVPSPLNNQFVAELPAGITYSATGFQTCPLATVMAATGATPPACPAGSVAGSGSATFQAVLGTQMLNEPSNITIYLTQANPITLAFWGNGTKPIAETKIFTGTLAPDGTPYGEKLITNVPQITTVPGGPDASVTQFSSTLYAVRTLKQTKMVKKGKKKVKQTVTATVSAITLPKKCSGSLSWKGTASFEDMSSVTQTATTACP